MDKLKEVKTLADFKRLDVGDSLTQLENTWFPVNNKLAGIKRKIVVKQSNRICFEDLSWLEYPKASDFSIDENGIIKISIDEEGGFMSYKIN